MRLDETTDWPQLVDRCLGGWTPVPLGDPDSGGPALLLGWVYTWLLGTPLADAVSFAVAARRDDPDPLVRGRVLWFVQRRVQFEKLLGQKAESWPQTTQCLDTMSTTAKTMIASEETKSKADASAVDDKLVGLPEEAKKRVAKAIGGPVNIGFAGTVGSSFDAIKQVLDDGTITQRCVALANFADKYLIPGLLQGGSELTRIVNEKLGSEKESLAFAAALAEAKNTTDEKQQRALLLTNEGFRAKIQKAKAGSAQSNAERTAEKQALTGNANAALEQGATLNGMDSKQVAQPVELCTIEQLDFLAGSVNPAGFPNFKRAEYDKKRLKADKVAYLISCDIRTTRPTFFDEKENKSKEAAVDATSIVGGATGVTQSKEGGPTETQAAATAEQELELSPELLNKANEDNFNYIEGKLENIVDPKSEWIKDANQAQAPLKAGISGTTARFVGTAKLLGSDANGAVATMLGHLQKIEAHSFWEIVDAAGIGAGAGKYLPFPPNEEGLLSAANEFVDSEVEIPLGTQDKSKALDTLLGRQSAA